MEIENQTQQIKSDSSDSWDPEQCHSLNNCSRHSLFQKITLSYDDQIIEKNIEIECQKPILNSQIFPFEDEQNDEGTNLQQTQSEPSQHEMLNERKQKKQKIQFDQARHSKGSSKPMNNEQALFNAIEDDQNQHWIRKKLRNQFSERSKISRPLTCPQCFTQICYTYEACNKTEKNPQIEQISETDKLVSEQKKYKAKAVDNVTIHEHKIIRNRFAPQNMQKKLKFTEYKNDEKGKSIALQKYEKELKDRYDDINVKILTSCSECGLDIGYWDANQEIYTLFNVI